MRLDPSEIAAIRTTAAQVFGPSATVRLFGSRVDDRRRGGDIDLYIEVDPGMGGSDKENDFSWQLENAIGEQRIDVLVRERGTLLWPIHKIAEKTGIILYACNHIGTPMQEDHGLAPPASPAERFRADMAAAQAVAESLAWSKARFAGLLPVDVGTLAQCGQEQRTLLYGLLKQCEVLTDLLQRRVFRTLLTAWDEAPEGMTAIDMANRLEAIEALESARAWSALVKLRNRLAHDYPLQPATQAKRLNEAYAAIDPLLATLRRIEEFVARKPLPEPDSEE